MVKGMGGFNYYGIDRCQVKRIVFYRDGGELFCVERGWLETQRPDHWDFNNYFRVQALRIDPVRANRVNLDRKDHFYTGRKGEGYTLFIHSPDAENIGEHVNYQDDTEVCYGEFWRIPLPCTLDTWEGPKEASEVVLRSKSRTERTKFGSKADEIHAQLQADRIDLPRYQVARMLELYHVVRK